MTITYPVASLPFLQAYNLLLYLYYNSITCESITLCCIIPGCIFLELEQKFKKPFTLSEGELKVEVTMELRFHSIPGIHRINHMNSNFAFSHIYV